MAGVITTLAGGYSVNIQSDLAVAEIAIQQLCPSDWIDAVLRDILSALPVQGMRDVPPFLTVNHLVGEGIETEIIDIKNPEGQWNENRKRFIGQVGRRFAREQRNPLVVSLLSEFWLKSWPKGEGKPKLPLRLQEVKEEAVVLVALTIDGRTGVVMAEILRDDEARISGLGEIKAIPCGSRQNNGESRAEAGILEPFFHGYLQARFGVEPPPTLPRPTGEEPARDA